MDGVEDFSGLDGLELGEGLGDLVFDDLEVFGGDEMVLVAV